MDALCVMLPASSGFAVLLTSLLCKCACQPCQGISLNGGCRLLDSAYRSPTLQTLAHWSRQPIRFQLGANTETPSPSGASGASCGGSPQAPRPDIANTRPFTAMKTPFAAARYQADSCGSSDCSLSWMAAGSCGSPISMDKGGQAAESGAMDDLRSNVAMLSMAPAATAM